MSVEKKYYSNIEDKCSPSTCSCTDMPSAGDVEKTATVSRRSFLKTTGFSFGALLVACSKAPIKKAIPFLIQPEEILPGKAIWYASTSNACAAQCSVHVKNRDGRPIKLEGNPKHPLNQGGLCSQCQASLLELYDSNRILHPTIDGKKVNWDAFDSEILQKLKKVKSSGKEIAILSNSITSPSTKYQIQQFKKKYGNVKHYEIDEYSYSAILDAQEQNYGKRFLPQYHFDKADVVVSIDADFLGSWISPVQFTKDFKKNRNLDRKQISTLIHVESTLSITGSKADKRIVLSPSGIIQFVKDLDAYIQGENPHNSVVKEVANQLIRNKGKSLIVCGVNDRKVQLLVNRINHKLRNINKTINHKNPSLQFAGSDSSLDEFLNKLKIGKIGAVFCNEINPVYSFPVGNQISQALKTVELTVSFSNSVDETSKACIFAAPAPHSLESWNDSELVSGLLSMTQPVLHPLGKTRSFRKSLSVWQHKVKSERDLVRDYWKSQFKSRVNTSLTYTKFWNTLVHDGFFLIKPKSLKLKPFTDSRPSIKLKHDTLQYSLYQTSHLSMGKHAQNPWLQELPNPITKVSWDNYISISEKFANKKALVRGDVVEVKTEGHSLKLPVFIQPGQHENTLSIALGYGRLGTERFHGIGPNWIEKKPTVGRGETVGKNASTFIHLNETLQYFGEIKSMTKVNEKWDLALTQTYNSLENPKNTSPAIMPVRPFIQETDFKSYKKDATSGSHHGHPVTTMWDDDHKYEGHHWGMAIDISACTGCSSCVIGCQVENNVPVVGKDEVLRKRDMAWLRIDRYYSGDGEDVDVAFQAMMCQHCDNAPCEPVCPVLATVHSTEGLNQQVYNRCVGTRFCANNCPYKVRRFNWFDYTKEDIMENMVLNPDVTVRSRGVMEKCSMCIQRIQEVKIEARKNGNPVADGEIKMACEQSCPADAIVFGDINDPESNISKLINSGRHYRVLEELNVQPTVGYLTQVRNRDGKSKNKGHHHG